jgi:hypothetical protein
MDSCKNVSFLLRRLDQGVAHGTVAGSAPTATSGSVLGCGTRMLATSAADQRKVATLMSIPLQW